MNCLKNLYTVGVNMMGNIVKERQNYRALINKQIQLIHKAVTFFTKRMETNMLEINAIVQSSKSNGDNVLLSQWEEDYLNWDG